MKLKVTVDRTEYEIDVEVEKGTPSLPPIVIGGSGDAPAATPAPSAADAAGTNTIVASLTGSVIRVLAAEGSEAEVGQVFLVLEAMKVETEITVPAVGTVSAILVKPGGPVQGGQNFIEF